MQAIYIPEVEDKRKKVIDEITLEWGELKFKFKAKTPTEIPENILKAIIGDYTKGGIELDTERRITKMVITPSKRLDLIYAITGTKGVNIFGEVDLSWLFPKSEISEEKATTDKETEKTT